MRRGLSAVLCAFLLCGCAAQEVSERVPVSAAALDSHGDGILLTAQTVTISGVDNPPETECRSIEANRIGEGMDKGGARLFWTTAESAVMDELIAERSLTEQLEALTEESSIRASIRPCVARGCAARDILETEDSPDGLAALLDDAVRSGQAVDVPLYQALDDRLTAGVDAVLPVLTVEQRTVRTDGTAVFHGDTLCGYLEEDETALLALLRGDTHQIMLYDGDGTGFSLTGVHTALSVTRDRAEITIRGALTDSSAVQAQRAAVLCRERCDALVSRLQSWNSDALGLGRELSRTQPSVFSASDWESRYPTLPVVTTVQLTRTQGGSPNGEGSSQ
ncbi:MAG: hypothetical protein MR896_05515 [Clostridiales bacterium]|nr:hypothetical protein [Clostridiales bacterium]